jgi:cell division protein FtsL
MEQIMYFILGMVTVTSLVVGVVIFNMKVKIDNLNKDVIRLNDGLNNALKISAENHQIYDRRFDEVYDISAKNLNNLNRDVDLQFINQDRRIDDFNREVELQFSNLYRDIDSRFDKFENRFKKELIKG